MKLIVTALLLSIANMSLAANISGKITVMEKGGNNPLSSYEHAIVYLTGVTTAAPKKAVLNDQKNKKFQPRLLAVVAGQQVDFRNLDRVRHNVFSSDKRNAFDLGRYAKGKTKSIKYETEGQYRVYCNIHRKMISDIVVVPNQYFSLTNADGSYRITDVPSGEYTINIWHIYGGSTEKKIVIKNSNIVYNDTVVSTKVIRDIENHKNKNGKTYKKKSIYIDDYDDDY